MAEADSASDQVKCMEGDGDANEVNEMIQGGLLDSIAITTDGVSDAERDKIIFWKDFVIPDNSNIGPSIFTATTTRASVLQACAVRESIRKPVCKLVRFSYDMLNNVICRLTEWVGKPEHFSLKTDMFRETEDQLEVSVRQEVDRHCKALTRGQRWADWFIL